MTIKKLTWKKAFGCDLKKLTWKNVFGCDLNAILLYVEPSEGGSCKANIQERSERGLYREQNRG